MSRPGVPLVFRLLFEPPQVQYSVVMSKRPVSWRLLKTPGVRLSFLRAAAAWSQTSSSYLPCEPKPVWPSKTTRADIGRPGAALGGICRCDTGLEALGRISEGRRIRHATALVADYRQHILEQLGAMVGACHRAVRAYSANSRGG